MLFRRWMLLALVLTCPLLAQEKPKEKPVLLPAVRGLAIGAPSRARLQDFVRFIHQELAPRKLNTLVLRVDWNYAFESRPELRGSDPLTRADVKQLVAACRKEGIHLIPQINLLGHQSWAEHVGKLLEAHPELDETPWVKMPVKYAWPNADRLYCKSYCPLHPNVHPIVFPVVDEICEVFETNAFHAGMDEVFYLAEHDCPRCGGLDPADLFAGEVRTIRDHLAQKGRTLWIWGDRLLDGKTTGVGEWEGSYNNTHRAVDLIPKDVVICDWHYDRAEPTPVYFAMKGLGIITCPWNRKEPALQQVKDMAYWRENANPALQPRFRGILQTVWSDPGAFLDACKAPVDERGSGSEKGSAGEVACFQAVFPIGAP